MECTETVNRGNDRLPIFQPCGREAVEDGLCKMHLRVRDRRIERARAYDEKMKRHEQITDEAERLAALLHIEVGAEYSTFGHGYTGRMTVPAEWLARVAEHGYLPGKRDDNA